MDTYVSTLTEDGIVDTVEYQVQGREEIRKALEESITGGTFKGPDIEGVVLPGGADWQLTQPDGDVELYTRYTLKTSDGALIQVQNRVLMHMARDGGSGPYIRSVIDFEAPSDSPHSWLNHAIFLGTLTVPQPMSKDKPYVIISVYRVQ